MEFTDAYLEKGITGFHEYASAASGSVRNVRSSQTLHDVAKRGWGCSVQGESRSMSHTTPQLCSSLFKDEKKTECPLGPSTAL